MSEISTSQKVIMAFAGVSLGAFFLNWVYMTGFLSGGTTGIDLATTTESAASGKNLTMLFLTPMAAVGILAVASFASRLGRWAPAGQVLLAIAAITAPLRIVPAEIDYWTGGEVRFAFGLWLTLGAMVVVILGAFIDQVDRFNQHKADQERGKVLAA